MNWITNSDQATHLLNNGYVPDAGLSTDEQTHETVLETFKVELARWGKAEGITDLTEIGDIYEGYQDEHSIRAELVSWKMLKNGLLLKCAKFLENTPREYSIILTFDFEDTTRSLESPTIIVFSDRIIGDFELCDLDDTPSLMGFQ